MPLPSAGTVAYGTSDKKHEMENIKNVSSAFDKMQHDNIHDPLYENVVVKGNKVNIVNNDSNSCNQEQKTSNSSIIQGSAVNVNFLPSEEVMEDRQIPITSPNDASTTYKVVTMLIPNLRPYILW